MRKKQSESPPRARTIENTSFFELVEIDPELAEARRHYASQSPEKRRAAADWEYHAGIADELFAPFWGLRGEKPSDKPPWWLCVVALAIDPLFAPALLSVGSIEYQCGREAEAMRLFLTLTTLPEDTQDLSVIVDKAGDFLIDDGDLGNALRLYSAAAQAYPRVGLYPDALGYCLAKQGRLAEAVEQQRRAVKLEPENARYWSDLGWSLVEAKQYDEAQAVLEKAVALSPPDYDRAGNNLRELQRRLKLSAAARAKRGKSQTSGA